MKHHIRIIAPSSATENPRQKLTEIISFLKKHDFEVSYLDDIFVDPPLPFYSNTREIRLAHLKAALEDPIVDIIWAFRGGTGAAEIASSTLFLAGDVTKKILIGFSDITSLHVLFNKHYPSIHGPVLTSLLDKHPGTIEQIKSIILGEPQTLSLTPMNDTSKTHHPIKGVITGGNFTVFCSVIGTDLTPHTQGKILVLEDCGEPGYKIRRLLTHLEQADLVDGLAACIFGDFTNSDKDLEWALNDFIACHPTLPIFRASGIGHGEVNIPLVFGTEASIINGILKYSLLGSYEGSD